MGWKIRSGSAASAPSYLAVEQLGKACADVLPGRDYRALKQLFRRRDSEPFTVSPRDARTMAAALTRAAGHKHMPTAQAVLALKLAQSAQQAANTRRPWEWS